MSFSLLLLFHLLLITEMSHPFLKPIQGRAQAILCQNIETRGLHSQCEPVYITGPNRSYSPTKKRVELGGSLFSPLNTQTTPPAKGSLAIVRIYPTKYVTEGFPLCEIVEVGETLIELSCGAVSNRLVPKDMVWQLVAYRATS